MKLNKIVNISEDYDLKMSPYDPNHNNQGSIQSIDKLHDDNLEDD